MGHLHPALKVPRVLQLKALASCHPESFLPRSSSLSFFSRHSMLSNNFRLYAPPQFQTYALPPLQGGKRNDSGGISKETMQGCSSIRLPRFWLVDIERVIIEMSVIRRKDKILILFFLDTLLSCFFAMKLGKKREKRILVAIFFLDQITTHPEAWREEGEEERMARVKMPGEIGLLKVARASLIWLPVSLMDS